MQTQGYKAYAIAQRSSLGLKELERMALARAIHELTTIRDNFSPGKQGYALYADALKFNQNLWTLIQSNIADSPDSGTAELRSNFLQLSLFVDSQTMRALQDPDPENLTPLIKINKIISGGLYGALNNAKQAAPAKAPVPSRF